MTDIRILNCLDCLEEVPVKKSVPKVRCDKCRVKERRKRNRERYWIRNGKLPPKRKRKPGRQPAKFVLQFTPETREEGAYPVGAEFSRTELAFMLRNRSIAPGTVLYDSRKEVDWTVTVMDPRPYVVEERYVLQAPGGKVFVPRIYGYTHKY